MSNTTTKQGQSTVNGLGVNPEAYNYADIFDNGTPMVVRPISDEAEANTTAELDAYLDRQLALQGELTKMTEPREVTMKRLYLKLEELEAEMEQLHREGAAEGEYHDDLENAINDLYNEIGE